MPNRTNRRSLAALTAVPVLAAGLTACGSGNDEDVLRVAASPTPHAEILQYVKDELADDAGLEIEILEFSDYVQPNVATTDGEVDANYFQHQPYLDNYNAENGTDLVGVGDVHVEPLGLYSKQLGSADDLADGAQVAIPGDATNGARALQLLADNGIIALEEGVDEDAATVEDIADNPKDLDIKPLEAAQLPRSLDDADAAVINTNYALEADLAPEEDALLIEPSQGNPYANLVATTPENEDDEKVVQLVKLLQSDKVKKFIEEEYDGAILAAF
ncbi:MetQ/NlpA family ABC transporter substrate-binding protein [Salininema proteolyticum]|uniref:Lipoprotein n=1 Tax=Salininema proteolyticum TaxID=1607685 RepID=A0ABV8TYC3_9ACTN